MLRFVGREYLAHESLRLSDDSLFEIDFLTLDRRDRIVGYEIMAHPLEDQKSWAKLEAAILEYPNIIFRIVDNTFYRRLKGRFSARIRQDRRFAGWENKKDNLKTNLQKYG